jgi:hypothetical protein
MEKSTKIINSQLDRASDFKYFALLGAFLFLAVSDNKCNW